jgi:signal transduction histidine kinase
VASDPALVARYHRTIRTETERLSELVDELFELSVIQAGALQVKLEVVSLADLVSEAIAAEGPAARAGRVRLESRVDRAPLEIRLAPTHVGRALRNLLENAIRHTPSDGSVSVEAGVDRDEAFVAVQDECGGIPLPDLDRVYETAFRGGAARTPAGGGRARAGLGLAIARGIVEAHRGAITVRNLNGGCRFEMRLPSPKAAP